MRQVLLCTVKKRKHAFDQESDQEKKRKNDNGPVKKKRKKTRSGPRNDQEKIRKEMENAN